MAQAEDTELRDLVVEALEKNGSLAKVRALLRANIFLAFEDECETLKQNETLDKMLQLPEGKFCLSIVYEFLEFCNLRNTLFVYKAETGQGKEYHQDSLNNIAEKINIQKYNREKEPMLLTLLKNCSKSGLKSSCNQIDKYNNIRRHCRGKINYKDEQNSTYIVNEGSSTNTSHTQSDSSDEKNKLDLRLMLDNSDTDTSSDSTRGQTSSEYIPNKHVDTSNSNININQTVASEQSHHQPEIHSNYNYVTNTNNVSDACLKDLKIINNSSTESTSYAELKPFNMLDTVLLNTPGVPFDEVKLDVKVSPSLSNSTASKIESLSLNHASHSISDQKKDISHQDSKGSGKNSSGRSAKYDAEATDYSYDFMSPPISARKDISDKQNPKLGKQDLMANKSNNTSVESIQQNSPGSQSSISLSDVADLISDKSSNKNGANILFNQRKGFSEKPNKSPLKDHLKMLSDDSGDFSESPIHSLSNLSLDIHSD